MREESVKIPADGSVHNPAEMQVPVLLRTDHGSRVCTLDLHTSFMAGEYRDVRGMNAADVRRSQVRSLASLLSLCLVEELVDRDAPVKRDERGLPEFSRWWYDVYLEECGPLLQPLGFPVNDGQCVLPDLQTILIPLDDA